MENHPDVKASPQAERAHTRVRRWAVAGAIVGTLALAMIVVLTIFAVRGQQEAQRAQVTAKARYLEVVTQRQAAVDAQATAEAQYQEADQAHAQAQATAEVAVDAQATSEAQRQEADLVRTQAQATAEAACDKAGQRVRIALSRQLVAQAQAAWLDNYPQRSLLLVVEALSTTLRMHEPAEPAAEQVLHNTLSNVGGHLLRGHEGRITALAISPDGHWLATGDLVGTVRLWTLGPEELMDVACRTAGRNLTRVEWEQYLPEQTYRKTCEQFPLEPEPTPTPTPAQKL